ncbi:hypothetical protein IWW57_001647 [Coemansia sp. S610]|nr:hypothetical protein LPJ60_002920 [Coemansia sp. RSA 2675]KAJ2029594.1 hypothetical protein IWW57_001647 [Coemansia sp. S610]KAJ2361879.1 hypothetical protein H4S02_011532 [Coemansia sp. RSA 2611]KAJ2417045.1 hypothetical protein GGI10_000501 [Coemansia sp. RSA 2530]
MFGVNILRQLSGRTLATTVNACAGRRLMSTRRNQPGTGEDGAADSFQFEDTASETRKQFANSLNGMIHNIGSNVVGRAVPVTNGHPSTAYGRLNRILMENNVRRELFLRKRYEKPKYKRQRLRRESHARLFKEEVRRKVHLVMNMRNWGM